MMLQWTDYLCYAEHMKIFVENDLFWNKSKVSSQSYGIDESIQEIRQNATYLLCHSFSNAENRYEYHNFTGGARNFVKNTERSNFENVVS